MEKIMTKLALVAAVALLVLGAIPTRAATVLDEVQLEQLTAGGGSIVTKNTAPYITAPKGATQPVKSPVAASCKCGQGSTLNLQGKKK
jgi:hypothetical protein